MERSYTDINAETIDRWVAEGWEWSRPVSHATYTQAQRGNWQVLLTPTKPVPHEWFCRMPGAKILGLASGGGQQIPVFAALGADCAVLDYSERQLENERMVAAREHYAVRLVRADMTKPFPFEDAYFDLIFHPVSNCYIEDVMPVWKECFRVLKKGGILLSGLDNGINYAWDEETETLCFPLPFNPLKDKEIYDASLARDDGIQFSHTIEEQIGGQIAAGFCLTALYGDTNGKGLLHRLNIPTFWATRSVKPAL